MILTGFFTNPLEAEPRALFRLERPSFGRRPAREAPATPDDRGCVAMGAQSEILELPEHLLADIGLRSERSYPPRTA